MENNELQLQRYQIIERIGEGGMANVYLAYDKVLKRDCAIKILKADLSQNPVALLRFRREADAASKLHHPSIVTIYDVGETQNRHFIVMEYVKGKTLKSLIQQRGAIEKQEAILIMTQILEGINVAHKAGVIHRDIKPQNILIKADGTVKITDFGIATTEGAVQLTQHDSVMGSVHYLAPECARGEQATKQSDIYSLGIVFYEMLTGEVPYKGDGAVQVAMKHLKGDIRPVREYNNSIEQSIENIIIKATAKNKQHRYLDVYDMLNDLKVALHAEHLNDAPIVLMPDDVTGETLVFNEVDAKQIKTSANGNDKRKRTILFGVIGLAVVVILGVLISTLMNRPTQPDSVVVPNVVGETVEAATEILEEAGFEVSSRITYEMHDTIEEGHVISTTPSANESAPEGSAIRFVVSEGVYFLVEDYTGWTETEVRNLFLEFTRIRIRVEYVSNNDVDPGEVLSQELLMPGDQIDPSLSYELKLTVSKPAEFVIPNVVGSSIETAKELIEDQGGVVTLIALNSDALSEEEFAQISFNTVVEISPEAGTLYQQSEGRTVELRYYEETDRVAVDKTALFSDINRAHDIDTTDKTPDTVEVLQRALTDAQGVYVDPDATQAEVDEVRRFLIMAIEGLETIPPEPEPEGDGEETTP